jgi:cellulose biosynthesis protein BcsQ
MLTINALTAAKEVLTPMAMELLALRGLDMLSQTIGKIRTITNPDLQYLGMLPTKYDKTSLNSKEIYSALQASARNAGIRVFRGCLKSRYHGERDSDVREVSWSRRGRDTPVT